jgi:hypothetical protein
MVLCWVLPVGEDMKMSPTSNFAATLQQLCVRRNVAATWTEL